MSSVLKQAAATSDALNDKFAASGPTLHYGGREAFDAGLSVWIGPPDTANTLQQMYIEHNSSEYASTEIIAWNYGVKTSAIKEWVAAAGEWTPLNKSHALKAGFELPRETKNVESEADHPSGLKWNSVGATEPTEGRAIDNPALAAALESRTELTQAEWNTFGISDLCKDHFVKSGELYFKPADLRREIVCLEDFMQPPTRDEEERWSKEGKEETERLSPMKQARRLVHKAKLIREEVLAIRLWSGPMYCSYSNVLRNGLKGQFTTTLHALVSGIIKLARIGTPETVYRGISGRAVTLDDWGRGVFVEYGAQSFTRDKKVATKYSRLGKQGSASYVLEVVEGEADQGADISSFSYYPYEKEKLYGPLVLMQKTGDSIEGRTLKLKMRVNINLHDGTLDEAFEKRKREVVSRRSFIKHDCREDWAAMEQALEVDLVNPAAQAWRQSIDERKREEEALLQEMFDAFGLQEAAWFNDDGNYKQALQDAIDFRKHSLSRLAMSVISDKRPKDLPARSICRPGASAVSKARAGARKTWTKSEDARNDGDNEGPREECDSNYPLYEADQAGLENAVECMLERRVGFREETIEEAARLVAEARRRRRWDASENLLFSVFMCPIMPFFAYALFFGVDIKGPFLGVIVITAGSFLFFYPSLKIWTLEIQPSDGFLQYEAWYVSKYAAIFWVSVLPFLSLWILSTSTPHPYYEFVLGEYEIDLAPGSETPYYQFTVWSLLCAVLSVNLIIDYGIQHLIVRRISMIGFVQRWAPDLLKFNPLVFAVNIPSRNVLTVALGLGPEFVDGWTKFFGLPASALHDSFSRQLQDIDKGLSVSRTIIGV